MSAISEEELAEVTDESCDDLDVTDSNDDSDDSGNYPFTSTPLSSSLSLSYVDWLSHDEGIQNNTETAITVFECFVSREWPGNCNDEAIKMLELQLHYGGGFSSNMVKIDLSTPKDVRLKTDQVLDLLDKKTHHSPIESVEKIVFPAIKKLQSGDEVMRLVRDLYRILLSGSHKRPKIDEMVFHFDEISDEFCAGDLEWIEKFRSISQPVKQNKTTYTVRAFVYSLPFVCCT